MRKIPRKYSGFVVGALMAIVMGLLLSFVVTLINLGPVAGFFGKWMLAYFGVLPLQLPIAIVVTPVIVAFVNRMSE